MTLITRSSFNGQGELKSGKKKMLLKKYVWVDEAGKVAETTDNNMPKTWRKAKLLGAKGQEVSDAQAKEWGLGKATKAKAPVEDKSK
jgi:hypothetical protein|tara:strand:- start:1320 stop:1580 length:261 start_codon:yes stop_codon:yes gene_type:complete